MEAQSTWFDDTNGIFSSVVTANGVRVMHLAVKSWILSTHICKSIRGGVCYILTTVLRRNEKGLLHSRVLMPVGHVQMSTAGECMRFDVTSALSRSERHAASPRMTTTMATCQMIRHLSWDAMLNFEAENQIHRYSPSADFWDWEQQLSQLSHCLNRWARSKSRMGVVGEEGERRRMRRRRPEVLIRSDHWVYINRKDQRLAQRCVNQRTLRPT